MNSHSPIGFDAHLVLDPSLRARLEKLAEASGRDASELAVAVLRDFVNENEQHMTAIAAGIKDADEEELLDYEDVKAELMEKLAALAKR